MICPANTPTAIQVASGAYVDPLNLQPEDVRVEDIAHALSHQCRFSGHTRRFYSVAEHSVRVCHLLRLEGHPERVQLQGLLHDAAEAYLLDLPRPLKQHPEIGHAYRDAEYRVWGAIALALGVCPITYDVVHQADLVLLATERRDLMPSDLFAWPVLVGVEPIVAAIHPMSSGWAYAEFMHRYRLLAGEGTS